MAVGAVVLNRIRSDQFPDTLRDVIYQKNAFTCVYDGQINLEPDEESIMAAYDALGGNDPSGGCTFYFNPDIATSRWMFSRGKVDETKIIGRHTFMK